MDVTEMEFHQFVTHLKEENGYLNVGRLYDGVRVIVNNFDILGFVNLLQWIYGSTNEVLDDLIIYEQSGVK